jgi:putative nucleotidyltransferase with HDIG domain
MVEAATDPHAASVARLARHAAPLLNLNPEHAFWAGLLHDVGKRAMPAELLNATRPLTPAEWVVMRRHAELGAALIAERWPAAPPCVLHAVRHHHERTDGRGYPDGLTALPQLTALVAACDVLDALVSDRPYRPAYPAGEALAIHRTTLLPPLALQAACEAYVQQGSRAPVQVAAGHV